MPAPDGEVLVRIEEFISPVKLCVALGIVLTELLTHSVKYGAAEGDGHRISVGGYAVTRGRFVRSTLESARGQQPWR